jgi:hypothetical protein
MDRSASTCRCSTCPKPASRSVARSRARASSRTDSAVFRSNSPRRTMAVEDPTQFNDLAAVVTPAAPCAAGCSISGKATESNVLVGNRKPQQLPPSVAENKKCEELLKGNRRNYKKINRRALGCAAYPRRASEARLRRRPVDSLEVHGTEARSTIANVEDLPSQPR